MFPVRRSVIQKIMPTDPVAVQLVEAAGLRDACDLDLLLFFSRHPRVVLSSEQLAAYVGYEPAQVARALDRLLETGLLRRTLDQGGGRMYVLEVGDAEEWLEPLRRVCATPEGRNALKGLLKQRQSPNGDPGNRHVSGARSS
jgi:DNA-binding transcriptional ArsR family regulator